jgi:putative transposase
LVRNLAEKCRWGCDRCAKRSVQAAWRAGLHSFRHGPKFIARSLQDWIAAVGASTAYIEPGSPWENGYCESLNARFRDELLNGKIFYSLTEARILIELSRKHYKKTQPHSAFGYRPSVPETIVNMDQRPVMH